MRQVYFAFTQSSEYAAALVSSSFIRFAARSGHTPVHLLDLVMSALTKQKGTKQ